VAVTPDLTTKRLLLEPLRVEHADEMVDVLAPRDLYEYYPDQESPTLDELRATYTRQTRGHSDDGTQVWHNWIIRLRSTQEAAGFIQTTVAGELAEIAWVVGLPWQGMGYATEAARSVRDACLRGDTGDHIVAVFCHIAPTHVKSQEVARALGLHPTDRWHDGEIRWEQDEDAIISTSRYLA